MKSFIDYLYPDDNSRKTMIDYFIKAVQDRSKLLPKQIVDKEGVRRTVYVSADSKAGQVETAKQKIREDNEPKKDSKPAPNNEHIGSTQFDSKDRKRKDNAKVQGGVSIGKGSSVQIKADEASKKKGTTWSKFENLVGQVTEIIDGNGSIPDVVVLKDAKGNFHHVPANQLRVAKSFDGKRLKLFLKSIFNLGQFITDYETIVNEYLIKSKYEQKIRCKQFIKSINKIRV